MSLLSQWNTEKSKLNTASVTAENIVGSTSELETLFYGKNQWRCLYYNITSSPPYLSDIKNTPCYAVQYKSASSTGDWAWGNNYIGVRECYIYCNKDYNLSTTLYTDDAGHIYVNEVSISTSSSCTNTSVTLPLKKGLNHIVIMFCEGSGADQGYITTNLSTLSCVDWMYACYKS